MFSVYAYRAKLLQCTTISRPVFSAICRINRGFARNTG